MPRRYHAESYRPAPGWMAIWETFYAALAPHCLAILQPTGLYEKFDVEPGVTGATQPLQEEQIAIESIASTLTVAAHCSHETPSGVIRAWLEQIARQPSLFRSRKLPPEVHWAVVSNYRRDGEAPGTHLQDVFGRRRVRFEAEAKRPTDRNIARAARLAIQRQHRLRGRPRNMANRMLAESLAEAFKRFGGRIVRKQVPVDVKGGGVLYVEGGPFFCFLQQVIGPLQQHLRAHRLPAVTIETIERIACEQFA